LNKVQHQFSAEKQPTLWHALPVIKDLQTAWEAKHNDERYALYRDVIQDGLDKLKKYYSCFDQKPAYVLALGNFQLYFRTLVGLKRNK
jgi:hypothetical protein